MRKLYESILSLGFLTDVVDMTRLRSPGTCAVTVDGTATIVIEYFDGTDFVTFFTTSVTASVAVPNAEQLRVRVISGSSTTSRFVIYQADQSLVPVGAKFNHLTGGIEFSGGSGRIPNSAFTASIGSPIILACSHVPFSLTGAGSTSETLMGQVIIPDDVMGPNSKLVIEPLWQWTNNANSKTFSVKIGNAGLGVASTLYTRTRTVNLSEAVIISLANRGVKNSQYLPLVADYAFNSPQQIFTSSHDFAQPGWSLYFSGSLANTTDTLAFLGVTVTVVNPMN